jgi:hypothetical protein
MRRMPYRGFPCLLPERQDTSEPISHSVLRRPGRESSHERVRECLGARLTAPCQLRCLRIDTGIGSRSGNKTSLC